jgi:hypothetical protein
MENNINKGKNMNYPITVTQPAVTRTFTEKEANDRQDQLDQIEMIVGPMDHLVYLDLEELRRLSLALRANRKFKR